VVFDAYKVQGGQGAAFDYHNIHIVYTKEAETADQYIEKFTNKLAKQYNITVATSDRLEQMIIWGQGARRLSAKGLLEEVQNIEAAIRGHVNANNTKSGTGGRNYLQIDADILKDNK
jgi:predicted RNA-binding protein with PIN domain